MNDDLPDYLQVPPPSPAPPELRARVLSAVERELSRRRKPRWERAIEWSVAASLLLGVGLSAWRWQVDDSPRVVRNDRVPRSTEKASEFASEPADKSPDRRVARRALSTWPDGSPYGGTQYEQYLKSWSRILEEYQP